MNFKASVLDPAKHKTDCLIIALGEELNGSSAAATIDKATGGLITRLQKSGDIKTDCGNTTLLLEPEGVTANRLLIVGTGKKPLTIQSYNKLLKSAADACIKLPVANATAALTGLEITDCSTDWAVRQIAQAFASASYKFTQCKSEKAKPTTLKTLQVPVASRSEQSAFNKALGLGAATASGINTAKELGDLPANICTPTYLAQQARKLARGKDKLSVKVLEEKQMRELGMNSLLSVSAGTDHPPKLILMEYRGAVKTAKPVVLVGKGVTFDSGGISIKPGAGMDEMKYDMCGAASVFGAMTAALEMKLPLNIVGVIPAVENMPSGKATKPGDIVESMSGQTIEILNTDAEGRLILCDALTYAHRYKPASIIDIATLTGACVIALGNEASGLYSNDDSLAQELLQAGQNTGDRAWHMPLWAEYDEQLKSNFADMANIGGRGAGSVTAACFLARYTKSLRWAHLDIAGTAWNSGANKGATGRPVPLLVEYLCKQAKIA